jgi:acyl-CoA hydrolase
VPTSRPLVEIPPRPVDERDRSIARHIAGYVHDGATLQVGLGTIPNALFEQLQQHRDLGLHTGVVGDGVIELIERGVITNAAKAIDTGLSVVGGLMGTRRLYDHAHRNASMRVEPVSYTHDPNVLACIRQFTAINSALEVDLTGQVNAEVAAGSYVGTIGGQTDFVRAAFACDGGRSVIGLPARTDGGRPRIVARIESGVVTTARADADVVVTEYGAAELRGQPISERVRRLVAIAHPDDRDALARAARSGAGANAL